MAVAAVLGGEEMVGAWGHLVRPAVVAVVGMANVGKSSLVNALAGEEAANLWSNIPLLKSKDEVKFVIASRRDYEWSREKVREHGLDRRCTVLFSPVFGQVAPLDLANWILEDRLPVRFQLQLHKVLWPPDQRGV